MEMCAICEAYEDRLTEFAFKETWEIDELENGYEEHRRTEHPHRIPISYSEPENFHYADA